MKPTIGRIVRYWGDKLTPAPAIVTEVDQPESETSALGLCVFGTSSTAFYQHVPKGSAPSAAPTVHTWTWPDQAK